ncbi:MAG: class I SAM-dependent methyltransferase [Thermodesulfobacteriota bacterium]|jgi:SAM-dependent methyltransferase
MRRRIYPLIVWLTCVSAVCAGAQEQPPTEEPSAPKVPYVPTPPNVVEEMLRLANVTADDVLYDLGCGDGRIVITAARQFGARGVGVDINPQRISEAEANARQAGVTDRVRFLQQDLFEADLRDATVVTLYLLPTVNLKLRPVLLHALRPGARVVSHEFHMDDWRPDRTVRVDDHKVYLWVIPAQVAGDWVSTQPCAPDLQPCTLHLTQQFQQVGGVFRANGGDLPLMNVELVGEHFRFVALPQEAVWMTFSGRVNGDTMTGHIEIQGVTTKDRQPWVARRQRSPL